MVVVKKSRFKSWERKLKSSAGSSVHISSELEKLTPHSTCGNCASLIQEQKGAPKRSLVALLIQKLVSYLLEPSLISAFSVAPRARAYFLPAKRTPVTIALPLEWSTSAAS